MFSGKHYKISIPKFLTLKLQSFYRPRNSTKSLVYAFQDSSKRILKCKRTTGTLITHLWKKHKIDEDTHRRKARQRVDRRPSLVSSFNNAVNVDEEESSPPGGSRESPPRKRKQQPLDDFLASRDTLRKDMLGMICESNVSINTIATCPRMRRVLCRAYPGENPPPKSGTTITKYLLEDSARVNLLVQEKLLSIRATGKIYV